MARLDKAQDPCKILSSIITVWKDGIARYPQYFPTMATRGQQTPRPRDQEAMGLSGADKELKGMTP